MKDYDAIAREIYRDEAISRMLYYDQQEDQCVELIAAILRKHDEAEAVKAGNCLNCGGPVYHRPGKPGEYDHMCEREDEASGELNEVLDEDSARALLYAHGLSSVELSQVEYALTRRPAPTDEKALRGEWLNAKTNPPHDAKKQVCINRNGGAFFARYAGGDWLDDDAFLRDPVLYISIPLLAHEAPKDASKDGHEDQAGTCEWSPGQYTYHSACGLYLWYRIPPSKICPKCGKPISERSETP